MHPVAPTAGIAAAAPVKRGPSQCASCAARSECLFGQLPLAQRERLQPWIHERSVRRHEVLQLQGEPVGTLALVKVGAVLLTREGADQRPRPIGIFGSGTTLGAISLPGQRSVLGVQAITALRLCEIRLPHQQQAELATLVGTPHFAQAWLRLFEGLADWSQAARVQGTTGQVAAALLLLGKGQRSQLIRLPSQRVLGGLLGTARESVARALARLEQQGRLQRRDRWHCEIAEDSLRACIAESALATD